MGMIPAEQWADAWAKYPSTTREQAKLAEEDLERWLNGQSHASFDPFRKLLQPLGRKNLTSFLEIGCGAGYYKPAFHSFAEGCTYQGVDISKFMVDYANQKWGLGIFSVANSESLPFLDDLFDCTCISGLIQHLADYKPSIGEAARISRRYVMLHRVEACSGPDIEFVRTAYDSEIPTRKVNQDNLIRFCGMAGLNVIGEERWSADGGLWNASILFEKAK